ncbi:MAG: phospholipase D-like domain-containing protein [Bacteroidota bacterium]|nr:phospholipase D-like domain-containing protein [Bacteroidota bacterium]
MEKVVFDNNRDFIPAEEIRLVHSGADYFDTLEEIINNAERTLHFQTYIFDDDDTGKRVARLLKTAAQKGVKVFVVLDGFGSKNLSKKFIANLTDSGVNFRYFSPFFSFQNIYIGRRLHHKVIVADSKIALVGGINIADKYRGSVSKIPWLDFAILVKGNVCEKVNKICDIICRKQFGLRTRSKKELQEITTRGNTLISFRQNDWLRKKNQISSGYIRNIRNSKESIVIIASYFLPGRRLSKALETAAKNNVKIKIILSGISDIPLFHLATSYLYSYLHKHHIEIYEWNKSVLHGKIAVIDGLWTTIGSYNLNHLSALGSIELNVEVLNANFANDTENHLYEIIENGCTKIEMATVFNIRTKILGAFAYFLVRIVVKFLALFPNMKYLYTRIND